MEYGTKKGINGNRQIDNNSMAVIPKGEYDLFLPNLRSLRKTFCRDAHIDMCYFDPLVPPC